MIHPLRCWSGRLIAAIGMLGWAIGLDAAPANPPATVLLDTFYNHENKNGRPYHYTWDDTVSSGFSKLGALFVEAGAKLEPLAQAPTAEALVQGSIYIIVDPDTEKEAADNKPNVMDAAAADTIARWVEAGGILVLLGNNRGNADLQHTNLLAGKFGIAFNEDSRNETPKGDLKRAVVDAKPFSIHPLFHNVQAVYMKEICTLALRPPARPILTAPKETGPGPDVLAAVSQFGKGCVVAIGDPWLYNEYIEFSPPGHPVQNRQAAVNLVRWLLQEAGPAPGTTAAPFMDYPPGTDPQTVGRRVAEDLLARPHMVYKNGTIHYAEACAALGALQFSGLVHDADLRQRLVERYAEILTPKGAEKLVPNQFHVDHSVFGIVPLEIYRQTGDPAYLEIGRRLADEQWRDPLPDNGQTRQTRWWIDDMYMVGSLQVQASRATWDPAYADRAGRFLCAYLDRLQQPNGLFFHGPDYHFFWGRGNGWVAAGLAEALTVVPETSPYRNRLLEGYRKMMSALLAAQGPDGLWRQLVDKPEAWEETSCSAMFTYAIITGVKNGWLDQETYGPAARKGWLGLVSHLDAQAELTDICVGTGQNKDIHYYMNRPRQTGDFHGQAPVLWCATALLCQAAPSHGTP